MKKLFYLDGVWLTRDVNRVCDDADLAEESQLVVRQKTVRFVEQKIAANEFFETPIFTLKKKIIFYSSDILIYFMNKQASAQANKDKMDWGYCDYFQHF